MLNPTYDFLFGQYAYPGQQYCCLLKDLQRLLVSNGYAVKVDVIFGALTETAVKAFQNQRNLTVDGIVGQRTWRVLTI